MTAAGYASGIAPSTAPACARRYARTDVRTYGETNYGRDQSSGPYQARAYDKSTTLEPVLSIYEPHKCQTYWGSHGCRKLRAHHGGHACDCGLRITPNGMDPTGFAWCQYGDDFDAYVERGGLAITKHTAACQAFWDKPRPNLRDFIPGL